MIRAVIFDWPGTLVRPRRGAVRPFLACASWCREALGATLSPGDFERAYLAAVDGIEVQGQVPALSTVVAAMLSWLGLAPTPGAVAAAGRCFFEAVAAEEALYDDARALLPALRYGGFAVGVATNSLFPAKLLRLQMRRLGIAGYVQAEVSSADLGIALPGAAVYRAALRSLGAEAFEAVYVTAVPAFAKGARAAGLRAVLLVRDARPRDRAGFVVIERLAALHDLLGPGSNGPRGHVPLL